MKKTLLCLFVFLLGTAPVWSADIAALQRKHKRIKCSVKKIERGGKHRKDKGKPHNIKIAESVSTNWSGYVSATDLNAPARNSVTDVSGTWIVPHVTPTETNAYSSIWVGIDGFSDGTVEQLGTEHDSNGGVQQNYAWFEMYPKGSYQINDFPLEVGDVITAEVKYVSGNNFQLSIHNETQQVYTIIPSSYTQTTKAQRSSAEWIVEAPATNTGILPLADFNTATLTNCTATINGVSGPVNAFASDQLIMETNDGAIKS